MIFKFFRTTFFWATIAVMLLIALNILPSKPFLDGGIAFFKSAGETIHWIRQLNLKG